MRNIRRRQTHGEAESLWSCILCGEENAALASPITKESSPCACCGGTWRDRALVLGLQVGLGHEPVPMAELSPDWSRVGVGFDDSPLLFSRLPSRIIYTNTHLHRFPRLDLCDPPSEARDAFEFAICSEVLEHVEAPVDRAFSGLASLLKPRGFAVVSVPLGSNSKSIEYYPDMARYEILENGDVCWEDSGGQRHLDSDPEYHGGTGLVLAFRIFGESDLRVCLERAGFAEISEVAHRPDLGVPECDDWIRSGGCVKDSVGKVRGGKVFLARMPG